MPFSRPTLSELRARVAAALGAGALLRVSNLAVMGQAQAGMANGHYGYLDWIAKQAVPFTSTDEYLEGWAALKGVTRKSATPATGSITFACTAGATIAKGALMVRGDGFEYRCTATTTATDTTMAAPVIATSTGADTNAAASTLVTLETAAAGVSSSGTFTAAATGGSDVEDDDSLRSRMLAVWASPPQGGSLSDYKSWALAVPGVTRAWVTPSGMGPGTVLIHFMMDEAEAAAGGFPQGADGVSQYDPRDTAATGDQLALANALFAQAPMPALVYAAAPIINSLQFTIAGLSGASGAVKSAVRAAITAALLRNAVPGGTTYLSAIESAIANVAGSDGFVITAIACSAGTLSRAPIGDILSNPGALPLLGGASFIA